MVILYCRRTFKKGREHAPYSFAVPGSKLKKGVSVRGSVQQGGFTLLEMVLYIGIMIIAIAVFFNSLYQIISTQERVGINLEILDNTDFLLKKIEWAMNNTQTINQPAAGQTTSTLSITELDGAQNPLVFDLLSGVARLSVGGGDPVPLTNDRVVVDTMNFTYRAPSTGPKSVQIKIRIKNAPGVGLGGYNSSTTIDTTLLAEH